MKSITRMIYCSDSRVSAKTLIPSARFPELDHAMATRTVVEDKDAQRSIRMGRRDVMEKKKKDR